MTTVDKYTAQNLAEYIYKNEFLMQGREGVVESKINNIYYDDHADESADYILITVNGNVNDVYDRLRHFFGKDNVCRTNNLYTKRMAVAEVHGIEIRLLAIPPHCSEVKPAALYQVAELDKQFCQIALDFKGDGVMTMDKYFADAFQNFANAKSMSAG